MPRVGPRPRRAGARRTSGAPARRPPAIAAVLPSKRREPTRWERIWAVVRRIPRGKVATYGQVAALAGLGGNARQAGYALHALPDGSAVPWHRVLNARGAISLPPMAGADVTQRMRLEKEGVRFDARGRVDLRVYRWEPARMGTGRVESRRD